MTQKKKTKKGDSGAGVDLLDKDKAKNKIEPPRKFKVVYHNDNYTPMVLVVISLISIYHIGEAQANSMMMAVHEKGKTIVQAGLSKEIAETKVNRTIQWFRGQGFPLLATFEPEE